MADSNAVRSKRKRLHAAGDHSMCRRCNGRNPLAAVQPLSEATLAPEDGPLKLRTMLEDLARTARSRAAIMARR